jgi:anhydro-N-acetylmuramic acid kinase
MSGTSLDGVDLACCQFEENNGIWNFEFIKTETIPYPPEWEIILQEAEKYRGRDLFRLDHQYGKYLGALIREFIKKNNLKPELIASHGHTIFHEPKITGSLQIGNGHDIHAVTGLPVISDFRSLDISLGGQGAPLVPAGDLYLFREYPYCLNLGGFVNISYKNEGVTAWDICPANTVLNKFSKLLGEDYDHNGTFGQKGKVNHSLFETLNNLDFYKLPPPRSLGVEFLENNFLPLVLKIQMSPYDILATLYEHISCQVSKNINNSKQEKVLVTGGGAKNDFLIEKIQSKIKNKLIIPSEELIDFKEALVFAFLGVLRSENKANCFASVTGASRNSSCGIVYGDMRIE